MTKIAASDFEISAAEPAGWPADGPPEIAFVGRSNVGKSSLLNVMAQRKGLARTSREPGRTRLTNFFRITVLDDAGLPREVRFVDLPGFGYAKVSKVERATWRPAIERYLSHRKSLLAVVLLVDARRVPDKNGDEEAVDDERDLARWIGLRGVNVVFVITKSDKLAKHERQVIADRARKLFGALPVLFSAETGEGRDKLWSRLLAASPASLTPAEPHD